MTPTRTHLPLLAAAATFALLTTSPLARADALPTPSEAFKGFELSAGLIPIHSKDGKSFAEIPTALFGKPLWISTNLRTGVGSYWLYANSLGPAWIGRFERGPNGIVVLTAQNVHAAAPSSSDAAYGALAQASYADSILGAWPAKASDAASVAIDANSMALSDLGAWGAKLEAASKVPYAVDTSNSFVDAVSNSPSETILSARIHYYSAKIPPGAKPPPLADPRSALIEETLSFSILPEHPMAPRAIDERVGQFATERIDLDPGSKPRERIAYGARWHLAKADPSSIASDPLEPIEFLVCPQMPAKYRQTVREGILMWNQAFEAIGYKGAVKATQLDADSAISAGGRKATVCFVAADDVDAAIGPSKLDPRTGEILEARVLIPEAFMNRFRLDFNMAKPAPLPGSPSAELASSAPAPMSLPGWSDADREALSLSRLRAVVAHEVGHALGLRHNFKGSAAYRFEDISRAGYLGPISASIMDYLPSNVYAGRPPSSGSPYQRELGAYDMWAIAYAYSAWPDKDSEAAGLKALLARSDSESDLAYASDEETYGPAALDPYSAIFDLSSDPVAFARSRFELAQWTVNGMKAQALAGTLDPDVARSELDSLANMLTRSVAALPRFFGGAILSRRSGPSKKPSLSPIAPAAQREAMAFLSDILFGDYLDIPPEVLSRAVASASARGSTNPSFDWANRLDQDQNTALKPFFTPMLTDQIMDASSFWIRSKGSAPPMTLLEVEAGVKKAVWRELYKGLPISRSKRNLQRDYVDGIGAALSHPANLSTDPRALFRDIAVELHGLCLAQSANPLRSAQDRSHLRDAAASLHAALISEVAKEKP